MMITTRKIWKVCWREKFIILVIVLLSLGLGLGFEKLKSPVWRTTVPVTVTPVGEDEAADFKYDHYYSAKAIDSITDSLEEWLKTQTTQSTIKKGSKASFRDQSWKWWEKERIKVRKKGPHIIEVIFYTPTSKQAQAVEKMVKKKSRNSLILSTRAANLSIT